MPASINFSLPSMPELAVGVGLALIGASHLYSYIEARRNYGKSLNKKQFWCVYVFILISIPAVFAGMDFPLYLAWLALGVSMLTFFDSGALSKTQQTLDQLEKITGIRALPDLISIVKELKSQFEAARKPAGDVAPVAGLKLICASPAIGKFADGVLYEHFYAEMLEVAKQIGEKFVVVCYDPNAKTDDEASLRKFARAVRYPEARIEEFVSAADYALSGLEAQSATVYKRLLSHDALRVLSKDDGDSLDPSIWFFHMCLIEYSDRKRNMIMWHLERPRGQESEVRFSCVGFSTSQPELINAFESSLDDRLAGYINLQPILSAPDRQRTGSLTWRERIKATVARWFGRTTE